jgi:RalA-binding protein 1
MSTSSPRPRRRLDSDDRGRVASGSAHAHGTSSSAAPHGELASVTSHASSSRLAANGPARGYVPLALADALARAGGDTTRALDEVLAERNKFCLEAGKLSGENVRIWNLMGRIRKENEALKTPSRRDASSTSAMAAPELTHSVSQASSLGDGAGSTTRAASFDVASTRSSPAGAQQQPPASAGAGSSSSGFAQARRSVVRARPSTGDRAVQPSSSSSSLSHDVSAVSSPLRSSGDDRREAVVAPARSGADAQSSIMAQRAAAQRRQPLDEPRAAEEADDFDAVDESVAGDTDGTSDAGAGLGLEPAVDLAERSADEPQVSTPRGGAPPEYRDEPLLATPGQRKGSISAIAARARQGSLSSSRGSISSLSAVPTPVLDSRQLSSAAVHVVGSMLRSNERGREVISFFISVALAPRAAGAPGATWRVEKLYSDVLALDARLKQKHGKAASKRMAGATLPDKMLFRDHAPSKVDQRKVSAHQARRCGRADAAIRRFSSRTCRICWPSSCRTRTTSARFSAPTSCRASPKTRRRRRARVS